MQEDSQLEHHREKVVVEAARRLDRAMMVRFIENTGALHATDVGRTASHFYIKHTSIEARSTFVEVMGNLYWGCS